MLDKFVDGGKLLDGRINGSFTTHCFRRGGAQHRFFLAKEKWTMQVVKWWGGWSETESIDTIIKYLLEETDRMYLLLVLH
jgi:hypothetical protein